MALTRLYTTELERLGHAQSIGGPLSYAFQPGLNAEELASADSGRFADLAAGAVPNDVGRAQEQVRAADVLTVIYPL